MNDWWQHTTIYQIYPRSYMDTNGDGIGDLRGIISKLDYLKNLGVETIWVSPFYKSPQMDHGYDISDYYSIDPLFGTMEDAEEFIKKVHDRDMKIIFDMVMNHTSIQHEWFKESKSNKNNPKRNWYIWRQGKTKRKPPNNWISMVGKKGWNYEETTNEWYYSSFLSFQPDLNYDNQDVKEAMLNIVRYWLEKGVDGFRLDIFNCIGKDNRFKDNPFCFRYFPSPENNDKSFFQKKVYSFNHPKSFEFAKELRKVVDEFPNRFLVGEVSGNDNILKKYIGENNDGLHTVFLFELIHFKFNKKFFMNFIKKIESIYPYPYIPTFVFSNHDAGRGIGRVNNQIDKGKILALVQFTNRGIPIIYYGDEIGMSNHDIPLKFAKDPIAKQNSWAPKCIANKLGILLNRDDCRTPMQWSNEFNAGFCKDTVIPWLPIGQNYEHINVETEEKDPNSMLNLYKTLLKMRRNSKALCFGKTVIMKTKKELLVYKRYTDKESFLILINFSDKMINFKCMNSSDSILLSTNDSINISSSNLEIPAYSGCIIKESKKG